MRVNVFITRRDGQLQNKLLVLPINPAVAIPPQDRVGWVYYATTNTEDRMFGDVDARTLEEQIAAKGFACYSSAGDFGQKMGVATRSS